MKKIVFFDVDGTLLTVGSSVVPESTVRAIEELQRNDIGVVLCTGRHPLELKQLDLLKYPFDGFVLLNGQLVLDSGMDVISARTIEGLDKEELISLFERHEAPMILVEKDRLFMNYHDKYVVQVQNDIASPVYEIDEHHGAPVFMSTIFVGRGEEKNFTNLVCSRWHDHAMDIFLPDGGKVYGIKKFMERERLGTESIIAFGDGDNDIEMLKFAGLGVAMGNAPDNVKAEADYVTDRVECDGIWKALKHFEII
ncbi:MAG: Cof-type HAD-IIB family hydrolase [Eubacterium sp.]|nr:Cof-type HAD-IIB family hydrolase [Eubacterium sp.]